MDLKWTLSKVLRKAEEEVEAAEEDEVAFEEAAAAIEAAEVALEDEAEVGVAEEAEAVMEVEVEAEVPLEAAEEEDEADITNRTPHMTSPDIDFKKYRSFMVYINYLVQNSVNFLCDFGEMCCFC